MRSHMHAHTCAHMHTPFLNVPLHLTKPRIRGHEATDLEWEGIRIENPTERTTLSLLSTAFKKHAYIPPYLEESSED